MGVRNPNMPKDPVQFNARTGRKERVVIVEWSEIVDRIHRTVRDGEPWHSQPVMNRHLMDMHRALKDDERGHEYMFNWQGGGPIQTLTWVDTGFRAPEFSNSADRIGGAVERRANWNEEDGDIDIGRLIAGDDNFFLGMAERNTKPAIRVMFEYAFSAAVSQKCIAEYGAWIAGLLSAMERFGFDLTVDAWICLDKLYEPGRNRDGTGYTRSNVLVRVKKENEMSDFTSWSAILSPIGYRVLGFTAKCVAGDKIGKQAVSGLGRTIGGRNWGLEYDREENIVRITVNQRAGGYDAFPAERLTKLAEEAGLIPPQS